MAGKPTSAALLAADLLRQGGMGVEQVASKCGLGVRQVERIAKKVGTPKVPRQHPPPEPPPPAVVPDRAPWEDIVRGRRKQLHQDLIACQARGAEAQRVVAGFNSALLGGPGERPTSGMLQAATMSAAIWMSKAKETEESLRRLEKETVGDELIHPVFTIEETEIDEVPSS